MLDNTYPERPHRPPARVVRTDTCDAERGCVAPHGPSFPCEGARRFASGLDGGGRRHGWCEIGPYGPRTGGWTCRSGVDMGLPSGTSPARCRQPRVTTMSGDATDLVVTLGGCGRADQCPSPASATPTNGSKTTPHPRPGCHARTNGTCISATPTCSAITCPPVPVHARQYIPRTPASPTGPCGSHGHLRCREGLRGTGTAVSPGSAPPGTSVARRCPRGR